MQMNDDCLMKYALDLYIKDYARIWKVVNSLKEVHSEIIGVAFFVNDQFLLNADISYKERKIKKIVISGDFDNNVNQKELNIDYRIREPGNFLPRRSNCADLDIEHLFYLEEIEKKPVVCCRNCRMSLKGYFPSN